jgi:hypothetical protein
MSSVILIIGFGASMMMPECHQCYNELYPLVFTGVGYSIYASAIWGSIPYVVSENAVGTAFGLATSIQNIGLCTAPTIVGFIKDRTKSVDHGYFYCNLFFVAINVIGMILNLNLYYIDVKYNNSIHDRVDGAKEEPAQEQNGDNNKRNANESKKMDEMYAEMMQKAQEAAQAFQKAQNDKESEAVIKAKYEEALNLEQRMQVFAQDVERDTLKAKWKQEKEIVEKIQNAKAANESLKLEAERAEREGDYGKVAEIRYGKIKEMEAQIVQLTKELDEVSPEKRLLKEEVDAEDIAESVAKATGIPLTKMLQSERVKHNLCFHFFDFSIPYFGYFTIIAFPFSTFSF